MGKPMIVVLNGPLGVGKSTLAEALAEQIPHCVMLDGDHLVAANPPHVDALEHLHSTITLLAGHHRRFGYRHLVINHFWPTPHDLADLRRRLSPDEDFRCFRLTLPLEENLRRIGRRAVQRANDELEYEQRTVLDEREALRAWEGDALGIPFEVDAPPADLVRRMLAELGLA